MILAYGLLFMGAVINLWTVSRLITVSKRLRKIEGRLNRIDARLDREVKSAEEFNTKLSRRVFEHSAILREHYI
jgi:hypothetical protein